MTVSFREIKMNDNERLDIECIRCLVPLPWTEDGAWQDTWLVVVEHNHIDAYFCADCVPHDKEPDPLIEMIRDIYDAGHNDGIDTGRNRYHY